MSYHLLDRCNSIFLLFSTDSQQDPSLLFHFFPQELAILLKIFYFLKVFKGDFYNTWSIDGCTFFKPVLNLVKIELILEEDSLEFIVLKLVQSLPYDRLTYLLLTYDDLFVRYVGDISLLSR